MLATAEVKAELSSSERSVITKLARTAHGGLLSVSAAAKALELPPKRAATKLATLTRHGWLSRARRGLYLVLPLEAERGKPTVAEDPWVLAREAFSPCYIGGWSAAEHWGLTEQIFRSTLVVTAANVRSRSVELLGQDFHLFRVPRSRIAGATQVWRGSERVPASDRERTIVDILRNPELGGGIRHVADILREYGTRSDPDFTKLIVRANEAANGATWKRLGYLAEILWPDQYEIIKEATKHRTAGNVKLDPTVRARGKLARRWNLWVNVRIAQDTEV
jgi:predicted transcriptional regulator of viral defense system